MRLLQSIAPKLNSCHLNIDLFTAHAYTRDYIGLSPLYFQFEISKCYMNGIDLFQFEISKCYMCNSGTQWEL